MRDRTLKYLLVLPAVFVVFATAIWPLAESLRLSFTIGRLNKPGFPQGYLGLENYSWAFLEEPAFWNSVEVTAIYTIVTVALTTLLALGLAMLLAPGGRLRSGVQTLLILPFAMSPALIGVSFRFMFNPEFGLFDAFQGGTQRSIDDLVQEVLDTGVPRVCVTGGEPLAQPNCWALLQRLCNAALEVSLETSGAMDITGIDERVSIVLDLKTPGSGESSKNLLSNLALIQPKDQIKVVVTSDDDFRWFELFCDQHPSVFQAGAVLISPSYDEIDLKQLASLILSSRHPYRMQLQLHKQIWGEESGR